MSIFFDNDSMELEDILILKDYIPDFSVWDGTINFLAVKFQEKFNVYLNTFLASDETYCKIDLYA